MSKRFRQIINKIDIAKPSIKVGFSLQRVSIYLPVFILLLTTKSGFGFRSWHLSTLTTHTITVNADEIIAEVNPLLFGQNFGPWMNKTDEFIEIYKNAGVTLLRFPAGNWGDENDIFPNMLDDLHAVADALDAEVVIHVRSWRNGTADKAADLVRYANVENDYGFKYWEIGNEPDLYVSRPSRKSDPVFDVNWYNKQFRSYADAMKEVDPSIKLVGPAVTGGWQEWIPAFLQANGDIVDVVSWHWYPNGHEMSPEDALGTPPEIDKQINTIRDWWIDPVVNPGGYNRSLPPLFLGEYSITWASGLRIPLGTQVGALWVAETIGRMAELGVEMGAHFSLMGSPGSTRWHGLVDPLKEYRPVFGVFQIFKEWGDTQVKVETSEPLLIPAFASKNEGEYLAILVLNKDQNREISANINLAGFEPGGFVEIYEVVEGIPEAVLQDPITVGSDFNYIFPPASITLFKLTQKPINYLSIIIVSIIFILTIGTLYMSARTRFGDSTN